MNVFAMPLSFPFSGARAYAAPMKTPNATVIPRRDPINAANGIAERSISGTERTRRAEAIVMIAFALLFRSPFAFLIDFNALTIIYSETAMPAMPFASLSNSMFPRIFIGMQRSVRAAATASKLPATPIISVFIFPSFVTFLRLFRAYVSIIISADTAPKPIYNAVWSMEPNALTACVIIVSAKEKDKRTPAIVATFD